MRSRSKINVFLGILALCQIALVCWLLVTVGGRSANLIRFLRSNSVPEKTELLDAENLRPEYVDLFKNHEISPGFVEGYIRGKHGLETSFECSYSFPVNKWTLVVESSGETFSIEGSSLAGVCLQALGRIEYGRGHDN